MNDEKRISEREAILRERAAYVNGMVRGSAREFTRVDDVQESAERAFPLPKVTRPRVVTIGNLRLRMVRGQMEWRTSEESAWWPSTLSPYALRDWISNLEGQPTEEVGADAEERKP